MMDSDNRNDRHKRAMAKQKAAVDAGIAAASTDRGVAVLLTGDGKGKTSAFGRFAGAGMAESWRRAVHQGRSYPGKNITCATTVLRLRSTRWAQALPGYPGSQCRYRGCAKTWTHAAGMLGDASFDLVLDELTYMLAFKYLPAETVLNAIENRPEGQSVVVTGRGGGSELRGIMDTVSEVKEVEMPPRRHTGAQRRRLLSDRAT